MKRVVVEAVGMWESRWFCAISKGGGKGGKPGFGFPCFPRTGISTAYLSAVAFPPFFCRSESPPEAVGLSSGLEDVRSIRDSVQQRLAEARVRNYLRPLGERQVRCEDDGRSLCAFSNHLEEKLGADFGEWNIANLVDCD